MRTRGVVAWACLLAPALILSGCGDNTEAVPLDSAKVSDPDRASCAQLLAGLPESLAGQDSRPVTPANALGAAWGDPAIILTCGGGLPAEFNRSSTCVEVNGVGWFVPRSQQEDDSSDITWTAVGYRPVVAVHVPQDYRPEGAASVIAELAAPVKANLELVKPCR